MITTAAKLEPSLLARAARWYAAHGYAVFQLTPGEKIPLKGSAGFRDATTNKDKITQSWQANPDANVGVPTGPQAGFWVLDIDAHKDGENTLHALEAKHGKLPDTVETLTPHGRHIWFKWPTNGTVIRNSTGKVGVGIDVRGEGGYVVLPPSRLANGGGVYQFEESSTFTKVEVAEAPAWLLKLVCEEKRPKDNGETTKEETIRDGTRNDTLTRMAGGMRRQGFTPAEIEPALKLVNNRCKPPLSDKEVAQIAHSVGRYKPAEPTTPNSPLILDDAAYYGLAGEIVKTIGPHTEADPAGLLVQFLIAFGSVIGDRPHFVVEADRHETNEFCVCVGETAKARKGTAWGQIRKIFEMIEDTWVKERIMSGLSSGEGLIWAVRDPIIRREKKGKGDAASYEDEEVDSGIADKRLLVIESEFASTLRVMGRDGNTLSPLIRQAWDQGNLRTMTKNSPAQATGAHISIIGHVTEDELRRYLDRTEIGNGFANRFLFVRVRRSKCLPDGGSLNDQAMRPLVQRVAKALGFARPVYLVTRDDEARELWAGVYQKLSEGVRGLFGAVTSRAEAHVMRLAMLYALLDESAQIRVEHLRAALAVWDYCEQSAHMMFGAALGDPVADEIVRALKSNPNGLSRTDISNLFGRNRNANTIQRALDILQREGMAYCEEVQPEDKGRPVELWKAT